MRVDDRASEYAVLLAPQALRDLDRASERDRGRLLDRIDGLRHWPDCGPQVRKLRGFRPTTYRLRVGNQRVKFEVNEQGRTILITRVLPRSSACKR